MNLADIITENASAIPDRRAIVAGDDGREMTWNELEANVNRFGNALLDLGVKRGDKVALYLPNCPEFVISYFAAVKIGLVVVPFNIVFKTAEIAYIVNNAGARYLIGDKAALEANVTGAMESFPGLKKIITVEGKLEGCIEFNSILEGASSYLEPMDFRCNDLVEMIYTSGTTGHPKGAMLSYCNLISMAEINRKILHINDEDLVYSAPPFCHIAFMIAVLGPFAAGAAILLLKSFNPERALEVMSRYHATHVIAVPTMYIYMLKAFDGAKHDLSSLRMAFSAGGPMPVEPMTTIEAVFGVEFSEQYGTTEATSIISFNRMGHRRLGSVGKPVVGIRVKIVDPSGNELPPNEVGEILVKGPGNCLGYWNMREATRAAFKDGWFCTGDLGKFDEDGYLYIVDRIKDMIVSSGYNVYPREIEDIIYTNPQVSEAAVVGFKDPVRQEVPVAFIRLKDTQQMTQKELTDYCLERLANYKVPRIVKFIDEMPKGPTGKISKINLKKIYGEEIDILINA